MFSCVAIKNAEKHERIFPRGSLLFPAGTLFFHKNETFKKLKSHLTCAAESLLFRNEVWIPTQTFCQRWPFAQTVTMKVIRKRKKTKNTWRVGESVVVPLYEHVFSLSPPARLFPRLHVFHMSRTLHARTYICGAKVNTRTLSQPVKPTPNTHLSQHEWHAALGQNWSATRQRRRIIIRQKDTSKCSVAIIRMVVIPASYFGFCCWAFAADRLVATWHH